MKIRDYLYSKAVTLCFLGIGLIFVTLFMRAAGMDIKLTAVSGIFYVLLVVLWLSVSFWRDNRRLKNLRKLVEGMEEKYLLGEVLSRPVNALEKEYYHIMKIVSRSAIGIAEQAMREKEEYCEYVESWIHEIKTPLTACSLIISNDGDIKKLKRKIKQADNLTESILYYARLRTLQKDILIDCFQAAQVINDAIKSQMELLIAAGISVETDGDFTVCSDAKSLLFMLKQLLINCAKYCPGCQIWITADSGRILVEDNGIGIPAHEISRVTERGFSGTNGRNAGGSTGMGLYIVRELCSRLDITLQIESKQHEYTRIILEFNVMADRKI
ncbi:MAG: HAMP domain-containing histidine kinase [Lachnospiraceae bacterium]|nr:HAMP domain-containing histidine kinase [Lachnospiraceae bacterium]